MTEVKVAGPNPWLTEHQVTTHQVGVLNNLKNHFTVFVKTLYLLDSLPAMLVELPSLIVMCWLRVFSGPLKLQGYRVKRVLEAGAAFSPHRWYTWNPLPPSYVLTPQSVTTLVHEKKFIPCNQSLEPKMLRAAALKNKFLFFNNLRTFHFYILYYTVGVAQHLWGFHGEVPSSPNQRLSETSRGNVGKKTKVPLWHLWPCFKAHVCPL